MKYDNKNALKLQISTYLEESLSMVGRMMLDDIFNKIDGMNEDDATRYVESHYDDNIFELIGPFLQLAFDEYEAYKQTPDGMAAREELKLIMNQAKKSIDAYNKIVSVDVVDKKDGNDNEGNGNVH